MKKREDRKIPSSQNFYFFFVSIIEFSISNTIPITRHEKSNIIKSRLSTTKLMMSSCLKVIRSYNNKNIPQHNNVTPAVFSIVLIISRIIALFSKSVFVCY